MNASLASSSSTACILVVDDLPDNCFLLQAFLEGEGYQVEVVYNGYAALDRIAISPPDLILLDVMMPEIDGFEVVRRIRQDPRLSFIPIVLVTGYSEIGSINEIDLEVNGLIRKPINFDLLLNQIRDILHPA